MSGTAEVWDVKEGDPVSVEDASGYWHDATAVSGVVTPDKFPLVWVLLDGSPDRMPWPVECVLPAGGAE